MKARLMEHAILEFLRLHPKESAVKRRMNELRLRINRATRGLKWCEAYIMLGLTAELAEKRHARGLKKCQA